MSVFGLSLIFVLLFSQYSLAYIILKVFLGIYVAFVWMPHNLYVDDCSCEYKQFYFFSNLFAFYLSILHSFFPITWESIQYFIIKYVRCRFFIRGFYQVEDVSFCSQVVERFFSYMGVEIFKDDNMAFLLYFVNIVNYFECSTILAFLKYTLLNHDVLSFLCISAFDYLVFC